MSSGAPPKHADLVASAHHIADHVLFPAALDADAAGTVPVAQLQVLADAGFYALSTHAGPEEIAEIIEIFAGGCLTTTFVWTQHLGAAAAAWRASGPAQAELGEPLASGAMRGGVAFAHMLRPDPPMTTAVRDEAADQWLFSGTAPWVTGWGHIDVVHAAARHGDDIVWALIDATESDTLTSERGRFAVVNSTQTDVVTFDRHPVPGERITAIENFAAWKAKYQLGLRTNGAFALGVATRCCRLLRSSALDEELTAVREALDNASIDEMAHARASASLFAVRAATALVADTGGRGVMLAEHAQRLMREAMFVLVQGQTPEIKHHMLATLGY